MKGRYPSPTVPKPFPGPLTDKEAAYVMNLVDRKMEPLEAYLEAGYTDTKNNQHLSKRLQRHLWLHIEDRIKQRVGETATLALNVLEDLMRSGESENVRLNAARDILSRAGYDATQRSETTIKEVADLTDEELDTQIRQLSRDNVVVLKREEPPEN
jgi:hypothetical protein|tara:strand:- start:103 stop:570 length:468 start_codon:yes stop_codon:yes gene_type:complete